MNIQAVFCAIVFSVGLIMLIVSSQESALSTDKQRLNSTEINVCRYLGIVIMVLGLTGLIYTFSEIIYRNIKQHRHMACECHASKWEKNVVKNYAASVSKLEAGRKELKIVKIEAQKTSDLKDKF